MIDAAAVAANLDRLRDRIATAGADPARIEIVAMTKGLDASAASAALAAGLRICGENRAQELLAKVDELDVQPEWHFTGRLQTNKVRQVADHVSCYQTLDRRSLVDELAGRAAGARALVQVNAAGEDHKGGVAPAEVADLVAYATDAGLAVEGLMAMGVAGDRAATRSAFATCDGLADDLGLAVRSWGMSGDLVDALDHGATMVRIGTALFGARPDR